jgi:hypothetical protein
MQLRKIRLARLSGAACGVLWFAAAAAQAAAPGTPLPASTTAPMTSTAKCREAVVSPVSGFAECVNPRGAPVAPPPKRPDAARAPTNR